ncbi:MAG TPA: DUF1801 domain-containing protein [Flavisolibacter sp.]|jgi:hypothetical protein|nr:DUF1801 domain-containing protein [Flavisolibacter sp.]
MNSNQQISEYITAQPESKRSDLLTLHKTILQIMPDGRLWFLDGKNEQGKIVTNPSIGYGQYTIKYADGKSKEFYQVGISTNTSGISVYIMGLEDKNYLPETYSKKIGKATVTGYCIKFKALKDINLNVLEEAICYAIKQTSESGIKK